MKLLWLLLFGWWIGQLLVILAWLLTLTIIGKPLGIFILYRVPWVLTLRASPTPLKPEAAMDQQGLLLRLIYFCLIGWWLSAIWIELGYLFSLTLLGLPLGMRMFYMAPTFQTLQTTPPYQQPETHSSRVSQNAIIGTWEGAHPIRDGSTFTISASQGEYMFEGTYVKIGPSLQQSKFSVGEVGFWLNPTQQPNIYRGRLKRRHIGSGEPTFTNLSVHLVDNNTVIATDEVGEFGWHRID